MGESRLPDYLDHMHQAASDACGFVLCMDKSTFLADKRTQQAVILGLVIIGEAATKIIKDHPDFVSRHSDIPWSSMKGMRNRIAHGYFDINLDVVWDTLQSALPSLLTRLPAVQVSARESAGG